MNTLYYIIIFLVIIIIILVIYIIQKINGGKEKIYKLNVEKLEDARKKVNFLKSLENSKKQLEEFDVVGNSFSELYLARKDLYKIDLVKVSLHNLNPETIKKVLLKLYTLEITKMHNKLKEI